MHGKWQVGCRYGCAVAVADGLDCSRRANGENGIRVFIPILRGIRSLPTGRTISRPMEVQMARMVSLLMFVGVMSYAAFIAS
jgi:hypothetical protein